MYLTHYGFREAPFNITPDPRFLYFSARHREALEHLLYGIRERKGYFESCLKSLHNRLAPGQTSGIMLRPRALVSSGPPRHAQKDEQLMERSALELALVERRTRAANGHQGNVGGEGHQGS